MKLFEIHIIRSERRYWCCCPCYHETLHRNLLQVYVQVRCRLPEGEFLLYSAEAKIAEMLYPSASKLCVAMSWLPLVGMGALASPSFSEEE